MCCGRCSACYSASLSIAVIVAIYARWVRRWQQWDFCDSGLGYLVEMNAALHAKVAVIVVSIRQSQLQERSITKNVFSAWIAFRSIKIKSAATH